LGGATWNDYTDSPPCQCSDPSPILIGHFR
jgi:hypothetical protein